MSGLWLLEIEPIPRTRILADEPGVPDSEAIVTPATVPSRAFDTFDTWSFSRLSDLNVEAAPVNDDFFCVP